MPDVDAGLMRTPMEPAVGRLSDKPVFRRNTFARRSDGVVRIRRRHFVPLLFNLMDI